MNFKKLLVPFLTLLLFIGACGFNEEDVVMKDEVSNDGKHQTDGQVEEEKSEQNITASKIKQESIDEKLVNTVPLKQVKEKEEKTEVQQVVNKKVDTQIDNEMIKDESNREEEQRIDTRIEIKQSEVKAEPKQEIKGTNTKKEQVSKAPEISQGSKQPTIKVKEPITPTPNIGVPTINALLPQENSESRTTPITHIVIHFISNAGRKPQDPYNFQDIRKIFTDYGVSAHYMIGRNGEIYHLVPENRVAFHAGKGNLRTFPQYNNQLNNYSIGIELLAIGTKEEMSSMMSDSIYQSIKPENIGYTDEQYQSIKRLLNDLVARNPSIKNNRNHIVGHDEYAPGRKSDPGSLFDWGRVGFK